MKVLKKAGKILLFIVLVLAGLYLSFYLLAWGDYEVAKTVEHDPSIPHIELDGVVLHSETYGSDTNQVVIVLHGGPGNDYRYLLDIKLLADEYFVVFYDQRGTGLSPRVPAEQLTVDNMVQDLYNIIQHYGKGEQVNIIGHSWGGMLASAYVAMHPETVDKLVLAEPGPLSPKNAEMSGLDAQMDLSWELLVHAGKCYFESLHVDKIDDQASSDYFFQTFVSNSELKNHPLAGYYCNLDISKANFSYWRFSALTSYEIMMKSMQDDYSGMNFGQGVERYASKVLFIAGACNNMIGPDFQEEQLKLFKDAEMVVIEDTGHFMFSEKPDESVRAVRAYFNH